MDRKKTFFRKGFLVWFKVKFTPHRNLFLWGKSPIFFPNTLASPPVLQKRLGFC